jgi:hypothetical protein
VSRFRNEDVRWLDVSVDYSLRVAFFGNETVLYSFTGGADGGIPLWVTLARDSAGNLYGLPPVVWRAERDNLNGANEIGAIRTMVSLTDRR